MLIEGSKRKACDPTFDGTMINVEKSGSSMCFLSLELERPRQFPTVDNAKNSLMLFNIRILVQSKPQSSG